MGVTSKKAAVLGASGYTGAELLRLISGHPYLELAALTGHSRAGEPLSQIFPSLARLDAPDVVKIDAVDWSGIDVAFACLPHGASQESVAKIYDKVDTIIDLSADFRLRDPALYADTYERTHDFTDLLKHAVYGLTEFARDALSEAKLVACPGCYPTASLLCLLPAIEGGLILPDPIIIDAKSGVSGAGRKTKTGLLFTEVSEGAHAYGVGNHRHAPEIDHILERFGKVPTQVSFTPHLVPMNRGEITTCYVRLQNGVDINGLRAAYEERYKNDPFVHIEPEGHVPHTRHVRGSNQARIGIFADRQEGRAIIIGVIDNLTKGSSGQAIQNYNLTQNWDETLGLHYAPLFP